MRNLFGFYSVMVAIEALVVRVVDSPGERMSVCLSTEFFQRIYGSVVWSTNGRVLPVRVVKYLARWSLSRTRQQRIVPRF